MNKIRLYVLPCTDFAFYEHCILEPRRPCGQLQGLRGVGLVRAQLLRVALLGEPAGLAQVVPGTLKIKLLYYSPLTRPSIVQYSTKNVLETNAYYVEVSSRPPFFTKE